MIPSSYAVQRFGARVVLGLAFAAVGLLRLGKVLSR